MNSGIYQLTHKDTGRIYIGQSINLKNRFRGYKVSGGSGNGNSIIKRAIKKHGWGSFEAKVLVYCAGKEYLDSLEIKCIQLYNSLAPNGFNIEIGGGNSPISEATKQAISKAKKGIKLTAEHRKKLSDFHKQRWASMSEEQMNKYRETGRTRNLGKPMSEEQRIKISETRKKKFAEGTLVHHGKTTGIPLTEEHKKKVGLASKKVWDNPEYKAKMKIIQSAAAKKRWENPEYRAKVLAAKGVH